MTRALGEMGEISQPKIIQTPEGWEYCPTDPDAYTGPDCEAKEIAGDFSASLNWLAKALGASADILKRLFTADLAKGLNDANAKIASGSDKFASAGELSGNLIGSLGQVDSQLAGFESVASNLRNLISSDLASLSSIGSQISSQQSILAQQTQAVADAQARLDYAMNRANYPFTVAGIKQSRADALSASQARATADLARIDTQMNISNLQSQSNSVGAGMNAKIDQLNTVSSQASSTLATRDGLMTQLDSASRLSSEGQAQMNEGMRDARGVAQDYQAKVDNILKPLSWAGYGAQGASDVTRGISQGETLTATGDALNSGLGASFRVLGDTGLLHAQATIGGAISAMTRAGEVELRSPSFDSGRFIGNSARNFGDVTIGYSSGEFAVQNISLGSQMIANGKTYEGATQVNQGTGASLNTIGTTITTTGTLMGNPLVAMGGQVIKQSGTLVQGLTQTAIETGRILSENPSSYVASQLTTSNFPVRTDSNGNPLGRNLRLGEATGNSPIINTVRAGAVSVSDGLLNYVSNVDPARVQSSVMSIMQSPVMQSSVTPIRVGSFVITQLPVRVEPGIPVATPPVIIAEP